MCQAIKELMEDSRIEGIEQGIEANKLANAKNLLDVLSDDVIAEKIGLPISKVQELRAEGQ